MGATGLVSRRLLGPLAAVSMLGFATAAGAGLAFLTQILLARELGPAAFGLFASSLATVRMATPLAAFGLSHFRLKAYGVEGWAAHRWLRPSLRFTVFTTLLALSLIVGWALVGAPESDTRFSLLVLAPVILSLAVVDLVGNKFRLEERFRSMATLQVAIPVGRLAVAGLLLVVPLLGYRFVAVGYCVVALLVTLWALPQLRALMRDEMTLKGHGPRPESQTPVASPGIMQLWSQVWAYGVAASLYPVISQTGLLLLKYLGNNTQAGLYGIALAVLAAFYLIPTTIYQKFLIANLHRWSAHDKPRFWIVYRHGQWAMAALGLLIAAMVAALSEWLVPIVFGEEYLRVADILLVLAACIPLRFLSISTGSALLTEDHMRHRVYAMAAAATVVVLLNLLLIPPFHAMGAAAAAVVGEAVLLLVTYYCVRRFVEPQR